MRKVHSTKTIIISRLLKILHLLLKDFPKSIAEGKHISTYDFSTLYTKLQHDDRTNNLNDIVDFAFNAKKDGNRKYLTVRNYATFWTKKKHDLNSFTTQQIKLLISHLIEETYFQVSNLLLNQCISIPMGIDPVPYWANLHLYAYEYKLNSLFLILLRKPTSKLVICCSTNVLVFPWALQCLEIIKFETPYYQFLI